ncbi:hypothetical protein [Luteolibacter soli]|uniref:Uncharacterized protein n=1 Tax=Luteolibacter soli TaxID=3135280 RepID=A0ABU9AW09_9BACT
MIDIEHIYLEDGPEDGRVLTADFLKSLISEKANHVKEISLYMDPVPSEVRNTPHLLGSYRLLKVRGSTASFRWQPA